MGDLYSNFSAVNWPHLWGCVLGGIGMAVLLWLTEYHPGETST